MALGKEKHFRLHCVTGGTGRLLLQKQRSVSLGRVGHMVIYVGWGLLSVSLLCSTSDEPKAFALSDLSRPFFVFKF